MAEFHEVCSPFGQQLYRKVWEVARLRLGLEERWFQDTLQYLGRYDPSTAARLEENKGSSQLFVNLTRPKTKVLRSRLVDILFPTDEATWDIQPTPVPRIELALAHRGEMGEPGQYPLAEQEIQTADREMQIAKDRATSMHRLIEDQLIESRYVKVGRAAITQACKLGIGVVKGPMATEDVRLKWEKVGDKWQVQKEKNGERKLHPRFRYVDAWDFYPDMDCSGMDDCEFVYELHRMSRSQLRQFARNGMFDPKIVAYLLGEGYTYKTDPGHFIENLKWVRQLENESDESELNRFLVFEYNGPIEVDEYRALCEHFGKADEIKALDKAGGEDGEKNPLNAVDARVWFCHDQILKFSKNPLPSGRLPYSVFRLDPSENTLIGSHGVPRMLSDPQSSLNAAWRMCIESGGLEGVPMFMIDASRIEPVGSQSWEIAPRKIWRTKPGTSLLAADGGSPIQAVAISGNLDGLITLARMSQSFMDDESSLPVVASGDQGSSARQTAHGMTLLANAVNVIFRDAARGFDGDVTVPNIQRIYEWNMRWSEDDAVKGDMEIKALGSSTLLINEVVSQNILMLMNLVVGKPDQFPMINFEVLVDLWFKTMRMDRYGLLKTKDELAKMAQDAAAQPPPVDPLLEGKKELAQMEIEARGAELKTQHEIAMMKLAATENMTFAQIQAGLDKVHMQTAAKERLLLAEGAIKERHGSGV